MNKILTTGATGQFAKATIEILLKKGIHPKQISAFVRDENKGIDLKKRGMNIIKGDYNNYSSLTAAFIGIDKLLFVSGNDMVNRISQHENVVKAAKEAGVHHIIYTSAGHNSKVEKSAIAFVREVHIKTEKWIEESGLPYTFLRNYYIWICCRFILVRKYCRQIRSVSRLTMEGLPLPCVQIWQKQPLMY